MDHFYLMGFGCAGVTCHLCDLCFLWSPDLLCVTSGDFRQVDEFLLELRYCEAHDNERTV